MPTSRDPLTVTCPSCAAEPGVACSAKRFPSLIVEHQARREAAAGPRPIRVDGDLFSAARAGHRIDTRPCPHCGDPIVDMVRGPVHFVVDPNGACTAWDDCKTGDQGALFGA